MVRTRADRRLTVGAGVMVAGPRAWGLVVMARKHANPHKINPRKLLPPAAELLRMHVEDGLPYKAIAKNLGVSASIVSERVMDSGLLDPPLLKPSELIDLRGPTEARAFMLDPDKACADKDPSMFFPGCGEQDVSRAARAICDECPVLAECLDWAVTHHELGIWGGTTEAERRKIRKQRIADEQVAS